MKTLPPFQPFSNEWVDFYKGQAEELAGGLSTESRNRVFEVDSVKYVLHTLENESESYMMQEAAEKGAAPLVYAVFPEKKQILIEHINHPTLTPMLAKKHVREIGASLKKVHEIPLFREGGKQIEQANEERWQEIQKLTTENPSELSESLKRGAQRAIRVFEEGMQTLRQLDPKRIANIHTDLHARNLFWVNPDRFLIIDWESRTHGHPYFDVASVSIFLGLDPAEEKDLLEGYFGRLPTREELREYDLLKKIRWAYTSIVNATWALRTLKNHPSVSQIDPPNRDFCGYMQHFAETQGIPSLEFFTNVAKLSLEEALKPLDPDPSTNPSSE
jgi:thiamine kinase-like enzyme